MKKSPSRKKKPFLGRGCGAPGPGRGSPWRGRGAGSPASGGALGLSGAGGGGPGGWWVVCGRAGRRRVRRLLPVGFFAVWVVFYPLTGSCVPSCLARFLVPGLYEVIHYTTGWHRSCPRPIICRRRGPKLFLSDANCSAPSAVVAACVFFFVLLVFVACSPNCASKLRREKCSRSLVFPRTHEAQCRQRAQPSTLFTRHPCRRRHLATTRRRTRYADPSSSAPAFSSTTSASPPSSPPAPGLTTCARSPAR